MKWQHSPLLTTGGGCLGQQFGKEGFEASGVVIVEQGALI